jgi:hypothetical protein
MEELIRTFEGFQKQVRANIAQWPDAVLMTALLAASVFLVALSFTPGHRIFKVVVLAYVLLP